MPKYRVTEYALVKIQSEPIEAEHAFIAYQFYRARTKLAELLRNVTGTKDIHSVEFADFLDSAEVDELDEDGQIKETVLHFSEEELNEYP